MMLIAELSDLEIGDLKRLERKLKRELPDGRFQKSDSDRALAYQHQLVCKLLNNLASIVECHPTKQ